MARGDVAKKLETFGVSPSTAQARVDAMTNEEVGKLAAKIDSMPAGASDDWVWWVVGAIVIGIIIWMVWYKK